MRLEQRSAPASAGPIPIAYVAPWVDLGGSDKGTVDWFRSLDRRRFAASLITTQPSQNRRLREIQPFADEVWSLPDLLVGDDFPRFIFDFIASRGVRLLHVMNSRLAFDLLPDLAALPLPPRVVVQLHVEEQDRSGYVRYVATRYGNLVDAFSVTSHHLAAAMRDYDVPESRIRVIHTGVDAEREFCPGVVPARDLGPGVAILYPGRLVEQKDPLLMVRVAAGVVARHPEAVFHVIGDGHLEPAVRDAVVAAGLERNVLFHGPSTDLRPWYESADALLMTSMFEGVPYTVYEAMAMALPVVAPALPGNVELMDGVGGTLVAQRDDVGGYVDAIGKLIADGALRTRHGEQGRQRMRAHFTLEQMASAHMDLYDELLASRRTPGGDAAWNPVGSEPAAPAGSPAQTFERRPSRGTPLVSVVIPCFNHGRWLKQCLASIREQTYPAIETIVVDDASTDAETRSVLDELAGTPGVSVIRQPANGGPSAARNRGLEQARGRYVLPVDADNLLVPDAVERLVEQISGAGARVGYLYPSPQYFGNRDDRFVAPDFNVEALLRGNFCDTCSLIDRDVLDGGAQFAEDIKLGHEDWDFFLSLAERGIRGEPASAATLLYRKHGFTRSDTVEYAALPFHEEIAGRHPALFADRGIKPRWAPGLSLVLLPPIDTTAEPSRALGRALSRQTVDDVEILARFEGTWPVDATPRHVRRLPPALMRSESDMLAEALRAARARAVLLLREPALLSDPALLEKMLRLVKCRRGLDAVALAPSEAPLADFAPLPPDARPGEPLALLLSDCRSPTLPTDLLVPSGQELSTLAGAVNACGVVQWHHIAAADVAPRGDTGSRWTRVRQSPRAGERAEELDGRLRELSTRLPGFRESPIRRWTTNVAWTPPEMHMLVRHRDIVTGRRIVTHDRQPPAGYVAEWDLGVVHRFSPPGTVRLETDGHGGYHVVDRGTPRPPAAGGSRVLGQLEAFAFPMLIPLEVAWHPPTEQFVLLAHGEDPLAGEVEDRRVLGWIDSFPIQPRRPASGQLAGYGLRGLMRAIDHGARRHRYFLADAPPADLGGLHVVGEVGALQEALTSDVIPVWVDGSGRVSTDRYVPAPNHPSPTTVGRWIAAPVRWHGFGRRVPRARAAARRTLDGTVALLRAGEREPARRDGGPDGYLRASGGPRCTQLYAAVHPVTGDQLLTANRFEAIDLGYVEVTELGYMAVGAPATGTPVGNPVPVPWASRFGLRARS